MQIYKQKYKSWTSPFTKREIEYCGGLTVLSFTSIAIRMKRKQKICVYYFFAWNIQIYHIQSVQKLAYKLKKTIFLALKDVFKIQNLYRGKSLFRNKITWCLCIKNSLTVWITSSHQFYFILYYFLWNLNNKRCQKRC